MAVKVVRTFTAVAVLLVSIIAAGMVLAQLENLQGMEAPPDVTGMDCAMCHGTFAAEYKYLHTPASEGTCVICHLESGEEKHGGLVVEDRGLCLTCHQDQEWHYPVLNCWASSCHADKHGSDVDALFNPSLQECYPGFEESTACAEYVCSDTCLSCHCDLEEWWKQSIHSLSDGDGDIDPGYRGCEGCHGPGGNHWGRRAGIGIFAEANVSETDTRCLKCHKDETYTKDYWNTMHQISGVSCDNCHNPHNQTNKHNLDLPANELCLSCHKTVKAAFNRLSHHPVELKDPRTGMLCVECHAPHGADGSPMLVEERDELCASCHADKAGPFVYEHVGYDPDMGQGCFTCHTHHGSNSPNLLMQNGRGVCLQCHTDMASHGGGLTCWTTGCHTEHHGSNSDFWFFN